MTEIFETIMLICFGISWPISVMKSYKARTAKGKSIFFTIAIIIGYVSGIAGKIVSGNINYVFILYIINILMVSTDMILYFRNRELDKKAEKDEIKRISEYEKKKYAA